MPPRKRRTVTHNAVSRSRRSTRQVQAQAQVNNEDIPDVFKDMLAEAYAEDSEGFGGDVRAVKRQKVDGGFRGQPVSPAATAAAGPLRQTVVKTEQSDEESDADVEFEDVELGGYRDQADGGNGHEDSSSNGHLLEIRAGQTLRLDLATGTTTPSPQINRRKAITKELRLLRLSVHKWHILCLLMHLAYRNQWCENSTVHKTLKPLVSKKILKQLHTDESRPQAERNFAFNTGIEAVCAIWKQTFTVNAKGLHRARWRDEIDMVQELEDTEDPIDLDDFKNAAVTGTGSRDLGAQLFCALLRSIAVETRLVHSLQVLPFTANAAANTPQKTSSSAPVLMHAGPQSFGTTSSRPNKKKKKARQFEDSAYPITWVEVFNPATMQWIPLDPVVRNTINKPRTGFEPPLTDPLNSFAYVVAFEDDGSARDVTLRYTSQFNAKIRSQRIENTTGGDKWWRETMAFFAKRHREPRDDIEDAALMRKLSGEGLPKNVQDFKGHPIYVLERHLRSNEVLEPKREVGKFSSGVGKKGGVESVYRREDVKIVRSSEAWYRRGRDVIVGEQPLKRTEARRGGRQTMSDAEDDIDDSVALYAEDQTQVYIPPSVSDGKVPKNAFGNLDVYVPSMIPAGAVHVRHPMAARAAQVPGAHAVDTVTGFTFKGRQGTAVIDGVVIAKEYTAGIVAVIEQLQNAAEQEIRAQTSAIAVSVWRKMYDVLRVRAKIEADYGAKADENDEDAENEYNNEDSDDGDDMKDSPLEIEDDSDDSSYQPKYNGGFMPDHDASDALTSTSKAEETTRLERLRDKATISLPDVFERRRIVVVPLLHRVFAEHELGMRRGKDGSLGDLFGDDEEDDDDGGGGFMVEEQGKENSEHDEDTEREQQQQQQQQQQGQDIGLHQLAHDDNTDDGTNAEGGFLPDTEDDDGGGGGFLPDDNTETDINANTETSLLHATAHSNTFLAVPSHKSTRTASPLHTSITTNTESTDSDKRENTDADTETHARAHRQTQAERIHSSVSSVSARSVSASATASIDPSQENAEEGWFDGVFESD